MKIHIYWTWNRLFRKECYTGNRLKYPNWKDINNEYLILWDFGALTIVIYKK
jgi:hypothetical protein